MPRTFRPRTIASSQDPTAFSRTRNLHKRIRNLDTGPSSRSSNPCSAKQELQQRSESGVDPLRPDDEHLHDHCRITVLDLSKKNMKKYKANNAEILNFPRAPPPSWSKCRWININRPRWDVIRALGEHKQLRSLQSEDALNLKFPTDWLHELLRRYVDRNNGRPTVGLFYLSKPESEIQASSAFVHSTFGWQRDIGGRQCGSTCSSEDY